MIKQQIKNINLQVKRGQRHGGKTIMKNATLLNGNVSLNNNNHHNGNGNGNSQKGRKKSNENLVR